MSALPPRQVFLGLPVSETHQPNPHEIINLFDDLQGKVDAALGNGGLVYSLRSTLYADLDHGDHASAWVVGDPTTG